MPQQLIYTSAPRGIVAGRSGYCTVARSTAMREALMLQLEKFSYYQHLALTGGQNRPIFACRIVDIRGTRFHVLSRLQDAGLDFTGRTNFIAHHLLFTPEEIRQFAAPPVILGRWPGWLSAWTQEPQLLENEDWTTLKALNEAVTVPAQTWAQVTGDGANGYALLEARAGATFRVDAQTDETVLALFAESLALLEVRDPRRDPRGGAWNYPFTTSMQEQDNPADFRWRCLHADNPASGRFATPDCRALAEARPIRVTAEEATFARAGRQPPRFTLEPQDLAIAEGEVARFTARAEGAPGPAYQWFLVDRTEKRRPMTGETRPELILTNPPAGMSRYVVRASNDTGDVPSRVATLSVELRVRTPQTRYSSGARVAPSGIHQKSEEDIERQRQRIAEQQAAEGSQSGWWKKMFLLLAFLAGISVTAVSVYILVFGMPRSTAKGGTIAVGPTAAAPASNNPSATVGLAETNFPVSAQGGSGHAPLPDALGSMVPPWEVEAIGAGSNQPSASFDFARAAFILNAQSGKILPNALQDSFLFVCHPGVTNLSFSARLANYRGAGGSRCGLMVRQSPSADAPFVFLGLAENRIVWVERDISGAAAQQSINDGSNGPGYFRLSYDGKSISSNYSADGNNWQPLWSSGKFRLAVTNYLFGFALCALADGRAHAEFDEVDVK